MLASLGLSAVKTLTHLLRAPVIDSIRIIFGDCNTPCILMSVP